MQKKKKIDEVKLRYSIMLYHPTKIRLCCLVLFEGYYYSKNASDWFNIYGIFLILTNSWVVLMRLKCNILSGSGPPIISFIYHLDHVATEELHSYEANRLPRLSWLKPPPLPPPPLWTRLAQPPSLSLWTRLVQTPLSSPLYKPPS